MASAIMHIAVAKEVGRRISKDNDLYMVGSIAPDICREISSKDSYRDTTHFIDQGSTIPNASRFLSKYKRYLDNDFVLGYYVHLLTDYIWFKKYVPKVFDTKMLYFLNGKKEVCTSDEAFVYIYKDYDFYNKLVVKKHDIDLYFLSKKYNINSCIEEIDDSYIGQMCQRVLSEFCSSDEKQPSLFAEGQIDAFIDEATDYIVNDIKKLVKN